MDIVIPKLKVWRIGWVLIASEKCRGEGKNWLEATKTHGGSFPGNQTKISVPELFRPNMSSVYHTPNCTVLCTKYKNRFNIT